MNTPPGQLSPRIHPGAVLMSPNGNYSTGTSGASTANLSHKKNTSVNMQGHYFPHSTLDDLIEKTDHPLSPTTSNPSAQHMNGTFLESFASPSQAPLDSDLISYKSQYQNTNDPLGGNIIDANFGNSKSSTVVNFTQDVNQLIYWMEKLSVQQQNTVMDNLLSSLNEEVLQYTKLKLDSLIHTGYISPSPIGNVINGFDLNSSAGASNVLGSFMPLETTMSAPAMGPAVSMGMSPSLSMHAQPQMNSLDYIMGVNEQPAGYVDSEYSKQQQQQWGSTNPMAPSLSNGDQPNSSIYDFLMGNRPRSADPFKDKSQQLLNEKNSGNSVDAAAPAFHKPSSKYPNDTSSSKNSGGNSYIGKKLGIKNFLNGMKPGSSSSSSTAPSQGSAHANESNSSHVAAVSSSASSATSSNQNQAMQPSNLTDVELLQNIPMWLKSLRLHKYTDNLKQYNWEELTAMSDADLQKNGIAALGARNKLLKAFKIVLDCKEQGLIAKEAYEH
ncbi:hypothetical protein ACO0QE_003869 [Hanseniaspora vineae]